MNDLKWSGSEKKIARRAFDAARDRALEEVVTVFKARAAAATTPDEVWAIGDDLYRQRRELDRMFDYRYSQLLFVFAELIRKGYLDEAQLAGLSEEKLGKIHRDLAWAEKHLSD